MGQKADRGERRNRAAEDLATQYPFNVAVSVRVADKTWPMVVYLPTRTLHAVIAAGGPADDSLYNFYTFCNRLIADPDQWAEIDDQHPYQHPVVWPPGKPIRPVHLCKVCQRRTDDDH